MRGWIDGRFWEACPAPVRERILDAGLMDWFDAALLEEVLESPGALGRLLALPLLDGLLEPVGRPARGAYRLHPLLREHFAARRRLEQPERWRRLERRVAEALARARFLDDPRGGAYADLLVLELGVERQRAPEGTDARRIAAEPCRGDSPLSHFAAAIGVAADLALEAGGTDAALAVIDDLSDLAAHRAGCLDFAALGWLVAEALACAAPPCAVSLSAPRCVRRPGSAPPQPASASPCTCAPTTRGRLLATARDRADPTPRLTERENAVLRLLDAEPDKRIAARLGLSVRGVRYRIERVFAKLGVRRRADAVRRARALGLLGPD